MGRSLQEYLRAELIEAARKPDLDTVVQRARERVGRTGTTLARDAILEDLGEDRR